MSTAELKISVASAAEVERGAEGWARALRPGGTLALRLADASLAADAKLPLLLNGFVLATTSAATEVLATKPEWTPGAKASLKPRSSAGVSAPPTKFQLASGDDLVDEDDLLAADGLEAPAVPDDVGCSARKPCAGCTCGRAEALAAENAQDAPKPSDVAAASSKCGSCHKGDAFRCASCPYLGKPAFKPGEEHLVLEMDDDL